MFSYMSYIKVPQYPHFENTFLHQALIRHKYPGLCMPVSDNSLCNLYDPKMIIP